MSLAGISWNVHLVTTPRAFLMLYSNTYNIIQPNKLLHDLHKSSGSGCSSTHNICRLAFLRLTWSYSMEDEDLTIYTGTNTCVWCVEDPTST